MAKSNPPNPLGDEKDGPVESSKCARADGMLTRTHAPFEKPLARKPLASQAIMTPRPRRLRRPHPVVLMGCDNQYYYEQGLTLSD